jgi:hypothetical protein
MQKGVRTNVLFSSQVGSSQMDLLSLRVKHRTIGTDTRQPACTQEIGTVPHGDDQSWRKGLLRIVTCNRTCRQEGRQILCPWVASALLSDLSRTNYVQSTPPPAKCQTPLRPGKSHCSGRRAFTERKAADHGRTPRGCARAPAGRRPGRKPEWAHVGEEYPEQSTFIQERPDREPEIIPGLDPVVCPRLACFVATGRCRGGKQQAELARCPIPKEGGNLDQADGPCGTGRRAHPTTNAHHWVRVGHFERRFLRKETPGACKHGETDPGLASVGLALGIINQSHRLRH